MCGRFTIAPEIDFHERFGIPGGPAIPPRYNVAPGQEVPVIVRGERNRLVPMVWGFIPPFPKGPGAGHPLINARAETLLSKPAFRDAVRGDRCLVPASRFYEWRRAGARRVPFHIRLKNGGVFSFAGFYGTRRDPVRGEIPAFTIITTEPNRVVAPLHDRMPAILPRGKEESWIRAGPVGTADLRGFLAPYPEEEMEAFPVSARVNDPRSEGPDLIRPLPGVEKQVFLPPGD